MDDILEHKGRREITSLTKKHAAIPICDCGSGLLADRTDLRFHMLWCCAACYPTRTDAVALVIEEDSRGRLYAQQRLPDGTYVSAPYKKRSIEEIVAAHTEPATPTDTEPLRV